MSGVLRSVAAILLAAFGIGACVAEKPQRDDHVLVVTPKQALRWSRNFNPFLPSQALWPTRAGIYEPLVIYDPVASRMIPWLASDWSWDESSRTLSFLIRENVRWSDGTPLTPEDVAFTFKLATESPGLDQLGIGKRVAQMDLDSRWVRFRLNDAFGFDTVARIGNQPIVPRHIWEELEDPLKFANESPVASGPYTQVLKFTPQSYELGRNELYWSGAPEVERIRVPALSSNQAVTMALIRGDVDWSGAFVPSVDRIFVQRSPTTNVNYSPGLGGTTMLFANTERNALQSPEVRKALAMAIERERIARIALEGHAQVVGTAGVADSVLERFDVGMGKEDAWLTYDPDRARSRLERAETNRALDDRLELIVPTGWSDWILAAEMIAVDLKKIGVDVRVRAFMMSAWMHKLQYGDFDLALGWSAAGATPLPFYESVMSQRALRPIGEKSFSNWQRYRSSEAANVLK